MDSPLPALRHSVDRLHQLRQGLDDARLQGPSYCREWSIADVFSHIGSGAVIIRRRLEDTLAGTEPPDEFAPSVWDEWNAKSPRAKADDALVADASLLAAFEAVSDADRDHLEFAMGPLTLDFDHFTALRLNEQAFHTWDIDVVMDGDARLPPDATALVVDNLELIARFTGRPTAEAGEVRLRTTDPERMFTVRLAADSVEFTAGGDGGAPDLVLPAEALCRLVYGRLDPDHTPAFTGTASVLDTLRAVFPGP